jgi:hypothetical protein
VDPGLGDWGRADRLALGNVANDTANPGTLEVVVPGLRRVISLGIGETATVLALVEALFAVFVWIQFAYLFGAPGDVGGGITYAAYARRGFFELVFVTVLSGGLLLALADLTRRDHRGERRLFSGLGTVLVALLLVVLASAFYRMHLYESAYGYTRLRLLVYVFMTWLGIGVVWLAAALWTRPRWFSVGAAVCVVGFTLTLTGLNPDARIAQRNLQRFAETGDLDVAYLAQLSFDATPVLAAALAGLPAQTRNRLAELLASQRRVLANDPRHAPGPAFNLGRRRAWLALKDLALPDSAAGAGTSSRPPTARPTAP